MMFINKNETLPPNSSISDQTGIIVYSHEIECEESTGDHVIRFWMLINEEAVKSVASVNCNLHLRQPCEETCIKNDSNVVDINENETVYPERCNGTCITNYSSVVDINKNEIIMYSEQCNTITPEDVYSTQNSACLRQMEPSSLSLTSCLIVLIVFCYSIVI